MLSKKIRFSRENFPKGKPRKRKSFVWGNVSVFDSPTYKAGVVVSKKAIRKAVDRNRAKRRAYAVLNEIQPKDIGVLLHLRKEALTQEFKSMVSDVEGAL